MVAPAQMLRFGRFFYQWQILHRIFFISSLSILQCTVSLAVDYMRLWWCSRLQSRKTAWHLQPTACTNCKKFWWCHQRWHRRCHNRLDRWIFTSTWQRWWRRLVTSRGFLLPARWFHERQGRGVSSLGLKHKSVRLLVNLSPQFKKQENICSPHPDSHLL